MPCILLSQQEVKETKKENKTRNEKGKCSELWRKLKEEFKYFNKIMQICL